jgi:hypothetical protein
MVIGISHGFREVQIQILQDFTLQYQQDMRWTCNVTLKRVRVTILPRKTIVRTYSECIFGALSYPACKLLAPYYVSPVSFMDRPYFSKLTHKRQDLRKNLLKIKFLIVFPFSL